PSGISQVTICRLLRGYGAPPSRASPAGVQSLPRTGEGRRRARTLRLAAAAAGVAGPGGGGRRVGARDGEARAVAADDRGRRDRLARAVDHRDRLRAERAEVERLPVPDRGRAGESHRAEAV